MLNRIFRIGTRTSPLALKQVDEIVTSLKRFYPEFQFEIVGIDTYGDKDKITPISEVEGSDFFTREIDETLLKGEIDFAIHSAKDLPDNLAPGLFIAAITKSLDPSDVLIAKDNLKIDELKAGAKIGTSSLRRKAQLKNYCNDLQIIDIRGNVEERLKLLDEADLDGIVVAAAGLIRLGLGDRITQRIPFDILRPHPLQGSLAIAVRQVNEEIISLTEKIDSRRKVIFICIENACRSQMAEGFLRHVCWQRFSARSGGIKPADKIDPLAIEVMKEVEIDISKQKPKLISKDLLSKQSVTVISMGCLESCPAIKIDQNWQIEDPKGKSIERFRRVRDMIKEKIKKLIEEGCHGSEISLLQKI